MKDLVVYSWDGVVLAAEGSLHIRAGKVVLTESCLVVEEIYFDTAVKTAIPIEAIKSIRKRASLKNTARVTLYKRISSAEGTIWEKKRRNFVFRDNRVCKMFVSAVRKSRVMEDEDAEEGEEEGERGAVQVTRHVNARMTAKGMTLDHHLLLENSVEFLRFADGETIIPLGMTCQGIYQVDFGSVNVTDGGAEGKEKILTQIPVGSSFGELQFVVGSSMGEAVLVAEDEVVVKFWSSKTLVPLMEKNVSFGAGFMGTVSKIIRSRLISITAQATLELPPSGEEPSVPNIRGTETTFTMRSSAQTTYKCRMKKPSASTQRGTLIVDKSGFMFTFRVFGLKTKIRTTHHELNKGEASFKLGDWKGKPAIEVYRGGERTLFLGDKIKQAYEAIIETREFLISATLGSDDGSLNLDDEKPSELKPEDWVRILEVSSQKKYAEAAFVVKEGEASNSIFQITKGSVSVQKQGHLVARLQEGAIFGEMSFLSWFTEGKDALVSADVIATEKLEMVCLDGSQLSALLLQDDSLCLRFFRYAVHLMSRRIEATLPMEGDWMKVWCPITEIKSIVFQKLDLHTWLKKDMKFPDDIVSLYRDHLKSSDFTTLQSLSIATDAELEKAGISVIHRRKMLWWVSQTENLGGEGGERGGGAVYLVSWMRKQMVWPEDVIERYCRFLGEDVTTVADLKKLGLQDLARIGIAPIHQRKIAFWMATNH